MVFGLVMSDNVVCAGVYHTLKKFAYIAYLPHLKVIYQLFGYFVEYWLFLLCSHLAVLLSF